MAKVDRIALNERIVFFYLNKTNKNKYLTFKHFKEEGVPKTTIYNVMRKYDETGMYEDLPRSGRPPKLNDKKVNQLVKIFNNKCNIGQRNVARQMGVS